MDLNKIQSECSKCTIQMQSVLSDVTNYINENLQSVPKAQNEITVKIAQLKDMISKIETHLQIMPSNDEEFSELLDQLNEEKEEKEEKKSNVTCDNNHALKHMTNNDLKKENIAYANGYICDVCRKSKDSSFAVWHCSQCGYDLCPHCSDKKSGRGSDNQIKCARGHEIKWEPTGYKGRFCCDICRQSVDAKSAHRCTICGYDLCQNCFVKQGGEIIPVVNEEKAKCQKGHELEWAPTGYSAGYRCDICRIVNSAKSAHRCKICGYDLCQQCFSGAKSPNAPTKSAATTCAKGHLLKWMKTGYRGNVFYCDICRKSVTSEFAHRCSSCGYDLCQECYAKKNNAHSDAVHFELKADDDNSAISCHNKHTLLLVSHPELISLHGYNYAAGYFCNICKTEYVNVDTWHCKICSYDMCLSCYEREHAKRNVDNVDKVRNVDINKLLQVQIRCAEHHICKYATTAAMIKINVGYSGGFGCDTCKQNYKWNSAISGAWQCSICSFDTCTNCLQSVQCQSNDINDKFAFKLMDCIKYQQYYTFSDVIKILTDKANKTKFNINYIINKYCDKDSKLNVLVCAVRHSALSEMKVVFAKCAGADLNGAALNGTTPIIQAAENDSVEMVEWLLSNGASPNSINNYDETAMWHACAQGNVDIIKLLIKYAFDWNKFINKASSNAMDATPLLMCCLNGNVSCLQYLFSIQGNYNTAIDVHAKAVKNQNALILSTLSNYTQVVQFLFSKTRFLTGKPSIINQQRSSDHNAPVHLAARWNNVQILELLKNNGADMTLIGENNLNALLIASALNKALAVKYLIESKSIDPNFQEKANGITALNASLDHPNGFAVCKILCSYDNIKILEHKRQKFDVLDVACMKGRVKCLQLLLTTLIKKNNISNWEEFITSNILTSDKTQSLILMAKITKQAAMKHFLENLTKNALANENFGLLTAMCDYDAGTAAKKKIEIGESVLSKNETIAHVLVDYLSNQNESAFDIVHTLNNSVNAMIENKEPINDMLLFFANIIDQQRLMNSLKGSIRQSLNGSNTRDYSWYKTCLLSSHIWSVRKEEKETESGILLFDDMKATVIDKELSKQQIFLSQQILNETQNEAEAWNNIVTFPEINIALSGVMTQQSLQDKVTAVQYMQNGCQVKYTQNELFTDLITGFDGQSAYDLDQYLNDLVITAHKINAEFQRQCRKLFNKQSLGVDCVFKPAPVKTKDRSQIKATVDYFDKPWPTTSSILDFVRCGISFKSAKDMMLALIKAKSLIDISKSAGCIKRIARIKNMFKAVPEWGQDLAKYTYCDIKFNVVIEYNNVAMIGEIQFLLDWMQQAKVLGHSLYGFVRNEEFVKELSNEWYENATEKDRMGELLNIVAIKNYKRLEKQLLYGDLKQIFSIKFIQNNKQNTLKDLLIQNKWKKGLKLYEATLKRFNQLNAN